MVKTKDKPNRFGEYKDENKSDIVIHLDKEDAVYKAGAAISGEVELALIQEIRLKELWLYITGDGRAVWKEDSAECTFVGGATINSPLTYKNRDVFLQHQQLLQAVELTEGVILACGSHKYPFHLKLPKTLPTSFKGAYGRIRYTVAVALKRPWVTKDVIREKDIQIKGIVDLNKDVDLVKPIATASEFRVGAYCLSCGHVAVEMRLSRKGYIVGEQIPIFVLIENSSRRTMRKTKLSLMQHSIFRAGKKTKRLSRTITSTSGDEITAGDVQVWEDHSIDIPPDIAPTTGTESSSVQVKYTVSLCVSISGPGEDIVVPIRISIGTVAFRRKALEKYLHSIGLAKIATPKVAHRQLNRKFSGPPEKALRTRNSSRGSISPTSTPPSVVICRNTGGGSRCTLDDEGNDTPAELALEIDPNSLQILSMRRVSTMSLGSTRDEDVGVPTPTGRSRSNTFDKLSRGRKFSMGVFMTPPTRHVKRFQESELNRRCSLATMQALPPKYPTSLSPPVFKFDPVLDEGSFVEEDSFPKATIRRSRSKSLDMTVRKENYSNVHIDHAAENKAFNDEI